ncbi:MAG: amylo-alpha-1,6-glucosidase [Agathobacter sp.]
MNFHFSKSELASFPQNAKREWALTNGIGGYAGGSVIGSLGRTHQGYLIASFHPPVERYLVFSKTNEAFLCGDKVYNIETSQHADKEMNAVYTEGQRYQTGFDYDGNVHFSYSCGDITMEKHIALVRGENKVAVAYTLKNSGDQDAALVITPLMNYREHSDSSTCDSLKFNNLTLQDACGFMLIPEANPNVAIVLTTSEGELMPSGKLYDKDLQFATEVENEVPGLDTCYTPYEIHVLIPAGTSKELSLVCYVDTDAADMEDDSVSPVPIPANTAFDIVKDNKKFFAELIKIANCKDEFSEILTIAANQFLSHRESTGLTTILAGLPWFTDWGRDTMIAFTGLVLSTGRYDKAEEILLTFAKYVDHGMIPNMFPDDGQAPLYNTVDASLWYFYAVDKYLKYNNTPAAHTFIQENIYPALKEIVAAYKKGTLFSIYMEEDGLIHAGSGLDQVTWMDVRVGDWVATPRHGKPVEINALWYNALMVMKKLATHYDDAETLYSYGELAEKVKASFREKFWNEADNCLYDVIDDGNGANEKDASIRPNQIYAVSLPYTMLDADKARAVVDTVKEKLFVGVGLRSLDPDHKDYHPIYVGSLAKRDAAYHQGTAWGFLLGGFITAYTKVYGPSPETAEKCLAMIEPVKEHLRNNCVGSICEIFDGDAPHNGRGCYAQAWSVGEVLRCYTEDILPYL